MSGWPLRRKIVLVIAVPLLFAATFGTLRVNKELESSADHAAAASQVTVLPPAVDYLNAAENAAIVARHKTSAVDPKRDAAVKQVDAAAEEFEQAAGDADLTDAQQVQVRTIMDLSQQLRNGEAYVSVGQSVSQVRQLHRGITQLLTQIVNEQAQPEPLLPVVLNAIDGRLSLSMQQFQVAYDGSSLVSQTDLAAEVGTEASAIDRLGSALGATQPEVSALTSLNSQRFASVRSGGNNMGDKTAYKPYDQLTTDLFAEIDGDLNAAARSARNLAIASAVVTGTALLVAVLLALMVARTLVRPIRRVRDGALQVAQVELPKTVERIRSGAQVDDITPIDVTTEEEMGQLARAFDEMHRQAITLASGEAELRTQVGEMFATLSRRNTTLINQQLGLIEDLERDEEDPRRLESLFRLDHLASRMRRTAESLMVLADAPTAGADGADLTIADLLQAAIAGVRDYQRVQILSTPNIRLAGAAAPDVVHLLTELVDNALNYSPPTAAVMVEAIRTTAGVEVEIADAGLGVATGDLTRLNAELASGGQVNAETARRMGLLVVSRLARRRGIQVRLELNERGGVTARVVLPDTLLPGNQVALGTAAPTPQSSAPAETPAPTAAATYDEAPAVAAAATLAPVPRPEQVSTQTAEQDSTTRYMAAIDALTRLPQRQPGRVSEPVSEPAPVVPEPEPVAVVPEPEPAPEPEPEAVVVVPEPAVEPEPVVVAPVAVVPTLVPRREPQPQTQREPLQDSLPAGEPIGTEESPIFATLQSNWFSSSGSHSQGWASTEVEAGWEAAHRVAEPPSDAVGASGLPVRRPGQRLVPGGVTAAAPPVVRDPEAIRARLAAHAAGVSRGRADQSLQQSADQSEKADLSVKEGDPA
ncbi:HAMP domain-containing sensor histidine kinase [Nocardioides hankookensis]|uniref:histidine kinase n=1 Tax=Nocardioides hankookensis TaxID=443157 RepID=A0ABW1LJG0_9ACTN